MARRTENHPPLKPGAFLWGAYRVRLGISMRRLARTSGVSIAELSRAESGRAIVDAETFDKVMAALEGGGNDNGGAAPP